MGRGSAPTFRFTKHTPREEAHPLFLVGIERLIERSPSISELFEIGSSLSQGIGAHGFNRINLALGATAWRQEKESIRQLS